MKKLAITLSVTLVVSASAGPDLMAYGWAWKPIKCTATPGQDINYGEVHLCKSARKLVLLIREKSSLSVKDWSRDGTSFLYREKTTHCPSK